MALAWKDQAYKKELVNLSQKNYVIDTKVDQDSPKIHYT